MTSAVVMDVSECCSAAMSDHSWAVGMVAWKALYSAGMMAFELAALKVVG